MMPGSAGTRVGNEIREEMKGGAGTTFRPLEVDQAPWWARPDDNRQPGLTPIYGTKGLLRSTSPSDPTIRSNAWLPSWQTNSKLSTPEVNRTAKTVFQVEV